jgi:cell division septum initiation protein DivIVA
MSAPEEIDQDNLKNEYLKLKEENEKLRQRVTDLQKQIESLKGDEGN